MESKSRFSKSGTASDVVSLTDDHFFGPRPKPRPYTPNPKPLNTNPYTYSPFNWLYAPLLTRVPQVHLTKGTTEEILKARPLPASFCLSS